MEDKNVIANNGYKHVKCVTPSVVQSNKKLMHRRIKARHEICIARIKSFNILNKRFRHGVKTRETIFHAVSKIVWLMINLDQPLFDI